MMFKFGLEVIEGDLIIGSEFAQSFTMESVGWVILTLYDTLHPMVSVMFRV